MGGRSRGCLGAADRRGLRGGGTTRRVGQGACVHLRRHPFRCPRHNQLPHPSEHLPLSCLFSQHFTWGGIRRPLSRSPRLRLTLPASSASRRRAACFPGCLPASKSPASFVLKTSFLSSSTSCPLAQVSPSPAHTLATL